MKYLPVATLTASLLFASGCKSCATSEPVLIGGGSQMFFPAGSEVPAVRANVNTNGWYSLSARDFNAILNP